MSWTARRVEIDRTAAELRLSTRQVYNPLARYRTDGTVTSWRGETAGRIILDGDWMNCAGHVGTTRLGNILR